MRSAAGAGPRAAQPLPPKIVAGCFGSETERARGGSIDGHRCDRPKLGGAGGGSGFWNVVPLSW
jgi:hypothetical protein